MNKKLLSLFGLKWNPFAPDVPTDALLVGPRIESFCWRIENLAGEGGWELVQYTAIPITGEFSERVRSYAYLLIFKRPKRDNEAAG